MSRLHLNRFSTLMLFALVFIGAELSAQNPYFNQRDDKYTLLGLKRAKQAYEYAKNEYDRAKELFSKQLISQVEYERIYNVYTDAEVNYQQSLLAVIFESKYVTIDRALKYRTKDGKNKVRLRVMNASSGGEELLKLINLDDGIFRSLQPEIIPNIYISLANDQDAIISEPYEVKIHELHAGKPKEVDFVLLQDVDAVTVNMIYDNGSSRSMKIYLQKDASQNSVLVQSQQFSQEVELGKTASFDLKLELYSNVENTFNLEVVNLPKEINRYFKDPLSQARLSRFKFTENVNTRGAALDVSLPDRLTGSLVMDKVITFYVLVMPSGTERKEFADPDKVWSEEEIHALGAGYVKLQLLPRGKGKLVINAQQLFIPAAQGETISVSFDIVNDGTRRLDNVEIKTDIPLNWRRNEARVLVESLEPGEEKRLTVTFHQPEDISPGRYELRMKSSALSDNQPVVGEDKIVTVEVSAGTNVPGMLLLILAVLGVIGGIVFYGIKLSKK